MGKITIIPMTEEQLFNLYNNCDIEELKSAYGEMLDSVKSHRENYFWYTYWAIMLKDKVIGGICFKGEPNNDNNYTVEVGYGIDEEFQGNGYATLALNEICKWAYKQKNNVIIQAQTEIGNIASQKVLIKNGFINIGKGNEGLLFEKSHLIHLKTQNLDEIFGK